VLVGGIPAAKPSTLVDDTDSIVIAGEGPRFVSRGGEKLAGALDAFDINVEGLKCLDAGASTGGFTDCLLQAGAQSVTAVDVGYGQLAWSIRTDPRVVVVERTNIRYSSVESLGGPFDVVVADLSFISLCTVVPALATMGTSSADFVLLVKPQFEAGKALVGRGGIVRDAHVRLGTVRKVVGCLGESGLGARGVVRSPLRGADGNVEFLLWAKPGRATVDNVEAELNGRVSYEPDS